MPGRQLETNPTISFDPNDPVILSLRRYAKPKGYSRMRADKRIEWTFGCSLDNAELVLSWDPSKLDPNALRIWKEMTIAVLNVGTKIGLSRARVRDQIALREIKRGLAARERNEGVIESTSVGESMG
jgi:hypothetical protein